MSIRLLVQVMFALSVAAAPLLDAQEARPKPAEIAAAVDSLAIRGMTLGVAPALGIAITMDGRTIYQRAFGAIDATAGVKANDQTLWYVASTSKSLTGFGVALLAQRGALRFDAPIPSLLPGVSWHAGAHADSLTLANFLAHTHHLNDNAVVMSAAFTGEVPESQWPSLLVLASPSGNQDLVYSNFGYNVAAMVIDRLQPGGWRRYLEQQVYRPAGMRQTFAHVSGLDTRRIARPHRLLANGRYTTSPFYKTDVTMNSAGGHLATLHDLARWTIVQMDSGMIDGRQVFPKEAVVLGQQLIARQTRENGKRFAYFDRDGWGAGWDLGRYEGEPMVSRFGSYDATRSHLSFLPRRRMGVVAMSTGGVGSSFTDIVAALAYDLEAGKPEARTRATQRLNQLAEQLGEAKREAAAFDSTMQARKRLAVVRPVAELVGRYEANGYGAMVVQRRDAGLYFQWGAMRGEAVPMDTTGSRYRIELAGSGMVLNFAASAAAMTPALTLNGIQFTRRADPH
ncbi:MAG TPA: serine hydrolase [Gemmatimonas sp.]|uniref:serine hydrolase domain-containing protein n=1 Tax=Gemmatimonas sp. TaxID=1962908 RepID=UPI002EDB122A